MRKTAGRAALISVMLAGGLLYAGIGQAQDAGVQDIRAERAAELVAASGGPASGEHLIAYASDRAAVEEREDDVAPVAQPPKAAIAPAEVRTDSVDASAPIPVASAEPGVPPAR